MRKLIFSLLAFTILMAPASVLAQTAAKGIPQFLPTTGWTVKPAVTGDKRQLKNIKLPCMMMVEYDNGYVMRLSGGSYNMMAMAVDFRQSAFVQGRKYQASISIDEVQAGRVEATAFSNNALVVNTRSIEKMYQILATGEVLTLDVEGNKFQFKLGDVSQALSRLEVCYSGKSMDMSTASLSRPMGTPQNILSGTPEQVTWTAPNPADVSMPASQPRRNKPNQIWRAREGDNLKATLTRWANEAGVAIEWQADMPGTVMSDTAMATSFEEAVQTLIAENAAATGVQAELRSSAPNANIENAYRQSSPAPYMSASTRPSRLGTPIVSSTSSAKWSAAKGTNLRLALERWSEQAGVDLHWLGNQSYAVLSPVVNNGTYEDAITQVLTQYSNESVRPFAELNNDPTTGRRTLIVQTSNVL